jgi:hypothetical protein
MLHSDVQCITILFKVQLKVQGLDQPQARIVYQRQIDH